MTSSFNVILGCNYEGFADGYYLKMFEYIGARRPILFVSDERYEEVSVKLLRKFDHTYEASSVEEISQGIKLLLKNNSKSTTNENELEQFTFKSIAKDYLKLLRGN